LNRDRRAKQCCSRQTCPFDRQSACCAVKKAKTQGILGIEVLPTERDALIRLGLLNKAQRNDKKAVRDALYEFFEKHLDPGTPPPSPVSGYQGVY
jgi:hypothetical protein